MINNTYTKKSHTLAQACAHQSIRKYTERPVEQTLVEQLILAGQSAASSSFLQVTSVIQVSDSHLRQELQVLAGDQPYISQCPVFLVFCADLKRNQDICQNQGVQMPTGFTEHALIACIDTGIFAQNVMLCAESMGLGGVYIGALRNNPDQVTELLSLPNQVAPLFGMCLGYPDQNPGSKPRIPIDIVLHQNHYQATDIGLLDSYDATVSDYYEKRTKGKLNISFSQHIAQTLGKEARPHMRNFMHDQGLMSR